MTFADLAVDGTVQLLLVAAGVALTIWALARLIRLARVLVAGAGAVFAAANAHALADTVGRFL